MIRTSTPILLCIALVFTEGSVRAQPVGSVDLLYGNGGVSVFSGHGEEGPLDLILRPDGGEFILCYQYEDPINTASIRAVTASGVDDASFSGDGWLSVASSVAGESLALASGLVDASGRLVAFGAVGTDESDVNMLIQRYQSNGTLDASFGGAQGLRIPYLDGAVAVDGALLTSGDMVFLANTMNGHLLVGKVSGSGSLVTSFGTNGLRLIERPLGTEFSGIQILVQPDGKLLFGAALEAADLPTQPTLAVVGRLNANGSIDASFGNDGLVSLDYALGNAPWESRTDLGGMHLDPNGEIRLVLSGPQAPGAYTSLVPTVLSSNGDVVCHEPDPVFEYGYQVNNSVAMASGEVLCFSTLYNGVAHIAGVLNGCATDDAIGADGYEPIDEADAYNGYPVAAVLRADGKVDLLMSSQTDEDPDTHPIIVRLHADDVVGLREQATAPRVRVSPQPVTGDGLFIEVDAMLGRSLQLDDLAGRTVAHLTTDPNSDPRPWVELPASLCNGAYVLRGTADGRSFSQKVVVQR